MRLLFKAYYEPKAMGGIRVMVIGEKLPRFRIPPRRIDHLIQVPVSIWEQQSNLEPYIRPAKQA